MRAWFVKTYFMKNVSKILPVLHQEFVLHITRMIHVNLCSEEHALTKVSDGSISKDSNNVCLAINMGASHSHSHHILDSKEVADHSILVPVQNSLSVLVPLILISHHPNHTRRCVFRGTYFDRGWCQFIFQRQQYWLSSYKYWCLSSLIHISFLILQSSPTTPHSLITGTSSSNQSEVAPNLSIWESKTQQKL